MISALAFGYGVGMTTPDSTIDGMRAAVDGYRGDVSQQGSRRGQLPPNVAPHPYAGYGPVAGPQGYPPATQQQPRRAGPHAPGAMSHRAESRQLARLRTAQPQVGHSCKLHGPGHGQPSYSSSPSYASTADGSIDDLDDLGSAGHDALSRLQLPDFQVPITRRALKYVRFLTRSHRGRDLFESWLKRSGRYQEMIQQTMREWHLPEDLIWVAMIESGFDPRVKSPAGAMGLWQFMRATGAVYGLTVSRYADLRKNPYAATRAAAHHLRDLYQRFGSWDLALAAYNMGYEQLLNAIDRYGTTDFNELSRQRAVPTETANYVPKIIAAALVANNLERYGFEDVKVYRPLHVAQLSVPGGALLSTVAKAAGISTGAMRKYNPHILTKYVPPGSSDIVYVPADTLSRARAALPSMLDKRLSMTDADVLEPRDLFGLSGAKSKLDKHNDWADDENRLRLLPKPKRFRLRDMVRNRRRRAAPKDDHLAGLAEEFGPRRSDREVVMYRVGSGDTLIGVAKQFAIDIDDLARDNGLDSDDKLREGALLKLMVKTAVLRRWKKTAGRELNRSVSNEKKKKRKKSKRKRTKAAVESKSQKG